MSDFNKVLFIIRGVAGAGKSTLAGHLVDSDNHHEADQYWDEFYGGVFIPSKLKLAHEYCQWLVENDMWHGEKKIAVANTFTREWEMKAYKDLAEEYGYQVHQIIVENTHGNKSSHQVPEETIQKMRDRFELTL